MRRLWVRGVAVGQGRRGHPALKRRRNCVVLVQELLQSADVFHRRPQGFHFAHLFVGSAVRDMLAQGLKAHVYLLDPVPFSLVAPRHGDRLLLGDAVAQSGEAEPSLAAQQFRRVGALSLQHFTLALTRCGEDALLPFLRASEMALTLHQVCRWHNAGSLHLDLGTRQDGPVQ